MNNKDIGLRLKNGSNRLLTASEVADILECSENMAYKVIRDLNEELKSQGYYTLRGKVSRKYLNERFFGEM